MSTSTQAGEADPEAGSGCPARKLSAPDDALAPAVERRTDGPGARVVIRSYELAKAVLRAEGSSTQAGFAAERGANRSGRMRPPILYLEGPGHRSQRRAAARFFAPKVTESYRESMERLADSLLAPLAVGRPVDLPNAALLMAVQVAGQVIGLTDSSVRGMSRRLNAFFTGDPMSTQRTLRARLRQLKASTTMLRFHWLDVRPAIRARRKEPRDDVISQLLEMGYSPWEVLTECVTYGAAGMVTTREFITMAAWHLLDDPDLLTQYRGADRDGRIALLHEVLRLEPVVGRLYRRTTEPVTLPGPDADDELELPAGTLVDLDVRATNVDTAAVGPCPMELRPSRPLARGVQPAVLSFGDGHHRCPGAPIAMMESEIFLSRLLAHDVVAATPPEVSWNDLIEGYELRRYVVGRQQPAPQRGVVTSAEGEPRT